MTEPRKLPAAAAPFGLIVTEGIYTDQAYSQGYANQPLSQRHGGTVSDSPQGAADGEQLA